MGIMARDRAAQEVVLMSNHKPAAHLMLGSGELQPEPQLPSGWEKCLDLKSGLIYFKDWNSGTVTYRDPRQAAIAAPSPHRIGLLSITLSSDCNPNPNPKFKRVPKWSLVTAQTESSGGHSSSENSRDSAMEDNHDHYLDHDQSLDLSLNLPGTAPAARPSQDGSACTMEKVRSALERLNPRKRTSCGTKLYENLFTALSLLSPRVSPRVSSGSLECSSPRSGGHGGQCSESGSKSSWSSPATSSGSEYSRFTSSPSVMSYQGDDDEVQQPRECSSSGVMAVVKQEADVPEEVMVTVGCKRCLMYVMISKSHPCCPRCGTSDAHLLQLPVPLPKKQRSVGSRSAWSW